KLLEWSDLNRPIMQRLSLEAPGTYAHTIAMANLVESAANAIGANGLLARVGTYYHDIGQLRKPPYFGGDQPQGRNPHAKPKPAPSATGANGRRARVCTYYPDIGKLRKPQSSVENQPKGRNPHDKLKPAQSAATIRNHMRDGLELADTHKLPGAVRAFIAEHH